MSTTRAPTSPAVYNRLVSRVAAREVENEDLVNVPNWLPLTFRPQGARLVGPGRLEVLGYRQELDLRRGLLTRLLRSATRMDG